jgi:hypothetical protein
MMWSKPNKYKNKKVEFDGIKFDSRVEMEYYQTLQNSDIVKLLRCQPVYLLQERFTTNLGEKIMAVTYKADFEVQIIASWEIVAVDIKWLATEIVKIKRKLFLKQYPDTRLRRLVKYSWNFVDYFENEKRKKQNKLMKSQWNTNWQL